MDHEELIDQRCGRISRLEISLRVRERKQELYAWLEKNPLASRNEILKKSYEIAGTLDKYTAATEKRYYLLQQYRKELACMSGENALRNCMEFGARLMFAAMDIAGDMPVYAAAERDTLYGALTWSGAARISETILSKRGIDVYGENNLLTTIDVSMLNEEEVIALIICTTIKNRCSPGALYPYLKNNILLGCLERLDALE